MKSRLSADLESKRLEIARSHNWRGLYLTGVVFAGLLLIAAFAPRGSDHRVTPLGLSLFLLPLLIEFYGLYRILQHDYELCRQLGYLCPSCRKPLYGKSSTWITGLCPKCGGSLTDSTGTFESS